MSRYNTVITLKVNDELHRITGFKKESDVQLHCEFEYWNKPDQKGFLFHSVEFYGMNPNGSEISICSDGLYDQIQRECIKEIQDREEQAYKAYLKETA